MAPSDAVAKRLTPLDEANQGTNDLSKLFQGIILNMQSVISELTHCDTPALSNNIVIPYSEYFNQMAIFNNQLNTF